MKNYIDCCQSDYASQWVERDANAFARRMLLKNRDSINEILKIEYKDWKVY